MAMQDLLSLNFNYDVEEVEREENEAFDDDGELKISIINRYCRVCNCPLFNKKFVNCHKHQKTSNNMCSMYKARKNTEMKSLDPDVKKAAGKELQAGVLVHNTYKKHSQN